MAKPTLEVNQINKIGESLKIKYKSKEKIDEDYRMEFYKKVIKLIGEFKNRGGE